MKSRLFRFAGLLPGKALAKTGPPTTEPGTTVWPAAPGPVHPLAPPGLEATPGRPQRPKKVLGEKEPFAW